MLKFLVQGYRQAGMAMAKTIIMPLLLAGGLYLSFFSYDPFAFIGNVLVIGVGCTFLGLGVKKTVLLHRAQQSEEDLPEETLQKFIEKGG